MARLMAASSDPPNVPNRDPTAQPKPLNVGTSAPEAVGVVTRTSDIKDCAKPIDRLLGT